jgi:hypothetical protein
MKKVDDESMTEDDSLFITGPGENKTLFYLHICIFSPLTSQIISDKG